MGKLLLASLTQYLEHGIKAMVLKTCFKQLQQQFALMPTCKEDECYTILRGSDRSKILREPEKASQSFTNSLTVP